jgi:hemolysin type calcium-binding protein
LRVTRGWLLAVLAAALLGLALMQPGAAAAAPGDVGFQGPSTVGAGSAPTGSKPESKVWWNDGFWWASMWDAASGDFHIFRLETGTQSWLDTGVALDERASTRADTLWDAASGKLYVASHVFSESPAAGFPGRLYRFSYNATTDTYMLDVGFPVSINNFRTETLVLAKDSSGQLWATWTQGGKVWVNATACSPACNDAVWGTAFVPSVAGTSVKSDDISSVIAFAGKIGVMWSNQNAAADYFAVHADADLDSSWSVETALQGAGLADDHLNLKTDTSGRIYAVVKTSKSAATDPLVLLLARSSGGGWSSHVFGRKSDHHTRPIVELDEASATLHVFATSPESAGVIYEKTSPTSSISFTTGLGTPVLKDADGNVNNITSTKQNVSPATGLVVLASSSTSFYFHQFLPLGGGGGGGGGTAPTASAPPPPPAGGPCTIKGRPGADVIVGTPGPDVICGLGGNDQIIGLGGNDRIIGGPGNDLIRGGPGRDVLIGGPGRDRLEGGAGADRLLGGRGDGKLFGGLGADRLLGGPGRDALAGGASNDRLVGSGGRDVYKGGAGSDTLIARDRVAEVVNGGAGQDRARIDRGLDTPRTIEVLF